MGKKAYYLEVQGKTRKFVVVTYIEPKFVPLYFEEGIEIFPIRNIIPMWIPKRYRKLFVFFQDIFNFNNPFRNPIITGRYEEDL